MFSRAAIIAPWGWEAPFIAPPPERRPTLPDVDIGKVPPSWGWDTPIVVPPVRRAIAAPSEVPLLVTPLRALIETQSIRPMTILGRRVPDAGAELRTAAASSVIEADPPRIWRPPARRVVYESYVAFNFISALPLFSQADIHMPPPRKRQPIYEPWFLQVLMFPALPAWMVGDAEGSFTRALIVVALADAIITDLQAYALVPNLSGTDAQLADFNGKALITDGE